MDYVKNCNSCSDKIVKYTTRARLVLRADDLTAICEPVIRKPLTYLYFTARQTTKYDLHLCCVDVRQKFFNSKCLKMDLQPCQYSSIL
jgi:hypothetical protein